MMTLQASMSELVFVKRLQAVVVGGVGKWGSRINDRTYEEGSSGDSYMGLWKALAGWQM